MSIPTILLAIVVFVAGIAWMILRALVTDQVRGQVQRRITADVEATIASLPAELQAEWAEEWRAELGAIITMPLTATRFARGLRECARDLISKPALLPLAATPGQQPYALNARHRSTRTTLRAAGTKLDDMLGRSSRFVRVVVVFALVGVAVGGAAVAAVAGVAVAIEAVAVSLTLAIVVVAAVLIALITLEP